MTRQNRRESPKTEETRQALLDELRRRIAAIERRPPGLAAADSAQVTAGADEDAAAFGLGLAEVDAELAAVAAAPAGLHEIAPAAPADAAPITACASSPATSRISNACCAGGS